MVSRGGHQVRDVGLDGCRYGLRYLEVVLSEIQPVQKFLGESFGICWRLFDNDLCGIGRLGHSD
jgi:hypothetical protein